MEAVAKVESELPTNDIEIIHNFGIEGLVDSATVENFLKKINEAKENKPTEERQVELLAEEIEYWRDYAGFAVPEIDINLKPFSKESEDAYKSWDRAEAKRILQKYKAAQYGSMAEIMPIPEAKPYTPEQFKEAEVVDMSALNAEAEMERIMPPETRTNAERYANLVTKAEAKAREYEQMVTLTAAETKRLNEIRADIAYFSEKLEAAKAAEKAKVPIEVIAEKVEEPENQAEIIDVTTSVSKEDETEKKRIAAREGLDALLASSTGQKTQTLEVQKNEGANVVEITQNPRMVEEVQEPGFLGKLFGFKPKVVIREAILPEASKADIFIDKAEVPEPPPAETGLRRKPVAGEKTLDLGNGTY